MKTKQYYIQEIAKIMKNQEISIREITEECNKNTDIDIKKTVEKHKDDIRNILSEMNIFTNNPIKDKQELLKIAVKNIIKNSEINDMPLRDVYYSSREINMECGRVIITFFDLVVMIKDLESIKYIHEKIGDDKFKKLINYKTKKGLRVSSYKLAENPQYFNQDIINYLEPFAEKTIQHRVTI